VIGMALKRPLRPGQVLRQADLMKPELVTRNEMVTLVYQVPGISLTFRGRALESGAEGDVVSVANLQSKRTIHGTVTGQGLVTVTAATPRIATASAARPRTE
jgi:flagella basal body P-ring formation protein FlgA